MADQEMPRGLRNNNPGNIRKNPANKWQGLAPSQPDSQFCTFTSMPYGIRAMARLLINYQDRKEAKTLSELITTWAPPNENVTENYVDRVARYISSVTGANVDRITKINTHNYYELRALVEGMIRVETGLPWNEHITEAQMVKGLTLAGVEAPVKPLQSSRTITGAQVAAAGVTASAIAQQVSDVQNQLSPLVGYSDYIKYAFLAAALIGIGLTVWAKIDERRKGIS